MGRPRVAARAPGTAPRGGGRFVQRGCSTSGASSRAARARAACACSSPARPGPARRSSAEVMATRSASTCWSSTSRASSRNGSARRRRTSPQVFDAAERTQAVLLFDEADALFGKRTEVSDAHDRYANLETAYLLSRLERFEGLAMLATNLQAEHRPGVPAPARVRRRFRRAGARPSARRCGAAICRRRAARRGRRRSHELAALYRSSAALIRNAAVAAAFLAAAERDRDHRRHFSGRSRASTRNPAKRSPACPAWAAA